MSTVSRQSTEEDDIPTSTLPTPSSTPKLGRRGRGGSFSGPGMDAVIDLDHILIFVIVIDFLCAPRFIALEN